MKAKIAISKKTNCRYCNNLGEYSNGGSETYMDCRYTYNERINYIKGDKFIDSICDLYSRSKKEIRSREEMSDLRRTKMYNAMKFGKNKQKYRHLFG